MAIITLDGTAIGVPPAATPGPVVFAKAYGIQTTNGTALEVDTAGVPLDPDMSAALDVSVIARSSLYSKTFRLAVSARNTGGAAVIGTIDEIRPPQGDDEAVAWMVDVIADGGVVLPVVIGEAATTITWDIEIVARTSSS